MAPLDDPLKYGEANPPMVEASEAQEDVEEEERSSITSEIDSLLLNQQEARCIVVNDQTPATIIYDQNTPAMAPPYYDYDYQVVEYPATSSSHRSVDPFSPGNRAASARLDVLMPDEEDPEKTRMVASGVAGAVVGSLLLGPFFGAIAGFGTAYATQKSGATGDIARALGEVALTARDKALEIDEKHHVVDNSKRAMAQAWEHAKELDRRHHILDRVKAFVVFSWKETVGFSRRHRLLERGVQGVGSGFEWLFKKIVGHRDEIGNTESSTTTPVHPY